MKSEKDISQYNDKDQRHGYWEAYWGGGVLSYKCYYHNGKFIGYCEEYLSLTTQLKYKEFNLI